MTIPYTEETWTFPEVAVVGGGVFWLSDFTPVAGQSASAMTVPPWVPSPLVFVSSVRLRQEQPATAGAGQIALFIDKNKIAYTSSLDPAHQTGDNTACTCLASLNLNESQEIFRQFDPPRLWDRTKDYLWFETDAAVQRNVTFELGFLIPNSAEPTNPNPIGAPPPPPPPPDPNWAAVAGPLTFDGSSSGWGGYTFAINIAASALAQVSPGTQTRVTLQGAGLVVDKVFAQGHALTFGGNAGGAADASGVLISDPITATLNLSVPVLIKGHATAGSLATKGAAQSGWQSSWKAGDDAASSTLTGYTAATVGAFALRLVEVHP